MNHLADSALENSIAHWTQVLAAEDPSEIKLGVSACALCSLFLKRNCLGCPVMGRTRESLCRNTPLQAATDASYPWSIHTYGTPEWYAARDEWREKAQAQLNFLISLRPAKEAVPTKTAGAA